MHEFLELNEAEYDPLDLPTVEGRSLCSSRDPWREAKQWYERHSETILSNKKVAVLGLGAGFHIAHLCQQCPETTVISIDISQPLIDRFQLCFPRHQNLKFIRMSPQAEFFAKEDKELILSLQAPVIKFQPAIYHWQELAHQVEYYLLGHTLDALTEVAESLGLPALKKALTKPNTEFGVVVSRSEIIQKICNHIDPEAEEAMVWGVLRELVR